MWVPLEICSCKSLGALPVFTSLAFPSMSKLVISKDTDMGFLSNLKLLRSISDGALFATTTQRLGTSILMEHVATGSASKVAKNVSSHFPLPSKYGIEGGKTP